MDTYIEIRLRAIGGEKNWRNGEMELIFFFFKEKELTDTDNIEVIARGRGDEQRWRRDK